MIAKSEYLMYNTAIINYIEISNMQRKEDKANVLFKARKFDDAIALFSELWVEDGDYRHLNARAYAYAETWQFENAIADYKKVLEMIPEKSEHQFSVKKNLCVAYLLCGNFDKSKRQEYRKLARDISSDVTSIVESIDCLNYVDQLKERNKSPESNESKLEHPIFSDDLDQFIKKALVYAALGNFIEANKLFCNLFKKDSSSQESSITDVFQIVNGVIARRPEFALYVIEMITDERFIKCALQDSNYQLNNEAVRAVLLKLILLIPPTNPLRYEGLGQILLPNTFLGNFFKGQAKECNDVAEILFKERQQVKKLGEQVRFLKDPAMEAIFQESHPGLYNAFFARKQEMLQKKYGPLFKPQNEVTAQPEKCHGSFATSFGHRCITDHML